MHIHNIYIDIYIYVYVHNNGGCQEARVKPTTDCRMLHQVNMKLHQFAFFPSQPRPNGHNPFSLTQRTFTPHEPRAELQNPAMEIGDASDAR